jgi:group II intron reverse transcriptase/maturase
MKADNFVINEGWPQEAGEEPRHNAGAQSDPSASGSGKDDSEKKAERLLEAIVSRENLNLAYKRVKANGGSHGVDGMTTEDLLPHLKQHGAALRQSILEGEYIPQAVRRVEIPKPDGGTRQLGIQTVVDRMIQQAIAQTLNSIFDKDFSANSYGFRPGRSAHMAIEAARNHIEEGGHWVVDIDLEKFFDRVNHDKLMSLVARKVKDKRVLKLIRKYLESGVLMNGIKVKNEEGTPQGGPLSPLLANIMLDELDKELERRGHKFCRYADDCNIYVKSKKAGARVMESITRYIESVLKLKVNRKKSAVDKPGRRKFLGFSFYMLKGKARNFVHAKSIQRFKEKVREITSRSNGRGMAWRRERLTRLIIGWVNYFRIADMRYNARELDGWIRRRIRMCYWKQWKKIKTKRDNLVRLGLDTSSAWKYANSRKDYWRISGSIALKQALPNERLEKLGFPSLSRRLSLVY